MNENFEDLLKTNQIVKLKLSEITPDPNNSRVHDVHNLQMIKKSLEKFGQYRPFVVQEQSKYIYVGNGMYQAMVLIAKENGQDLNQIQINCVVLKLTQDEANALSILDNKSTDSSYFDNQALSNLFKDMNQENIELTGFSNQQVAKILATFNTNIEQVVNPIDNIKTQQQKKEENDVKKGVLMYKLLFEDQSQRDVWEKFIYQIKGLYGQSTCQSLKMFIVDYYNESGKNIENI